MIFINYLIVNVDAYGENQMKMLFKSLTCLITGILVSGASYAADMNLSGEYGWFGVGKTYEMDKGQYYWVGEFSGTLFNHKGEGSLLHKAGAKCPGYQFLDFGKKTSESAGTCIYSDASGDKAYLTWKLSSSVCAGPGCPGKGSYTWTGGTGKYAGASGTNSLTGVTVTLWPDGTATGFAILGK